MATDIRSMIAYWKEFDLPNLQKELDLTASNLAVHCEQTDNSRLQLLEKSREFKKNSSEDVQKMTAPLLKSFQAEIDGLLRRTKTAESAFLSVYDKLIHMPDMLPVLIATEEMASHLCKLQRDADSFRRMLAEQPMKSKQRNDDDDDDDDDEEEEELSDDEARGLMITEQKRLSSDDGEKIDIANDKSVMIEKVRTECDDDDDGVMMSSDEIETGEKKVNDFRPNDCRVKCDLMMSPKQNEKTDDDVTVDEKKKSLTSRVKSVIRSTTAVLRKCDEEDEKDLRFDDQNENHVEEEDDVKNSDHENDLMRKDEKEKKNIKNSCHETFVSKRLKSDDRADHLENVETNHDVVSSQSFDENVSRSCTIDTWNRDEGRVGEGGDFDGGTSPSHSLITPTRIVVDPSASHVHSLMSFYRHHHLNQQQQSHHHHHLNQQQQSHHHQSDDDCLKVENTTTDRSLALDTLDVARRIRDILSVHNLGQRLFARYVLGLSQGTVSELLSKPKHWDKLTEKGRESYRKMYQWSIDERNINTLKSLSSTKCGVSSSACKNDGCSDERIAQILSEAQAAMQMKQETVVEEQINEASFIRAVTTYDQNPKPSNNPDHEKSPRKNRTNRKASHVGHSFVRNDSSGRSRKVQPTTENEHLTRDFVARIYHEELEKLAHVAEASGNIVELMTYRQELQRLNENWSSRKPKQEDKENHEEKKEGGWSTGLLMMRGKSDEMDTECKMNRDSSSLLNDEDEDVPQDLTMNGLNACSTPKKPEDYHHLRPPDSSASFLAAAAAVALRDVASTDSAEVHYQHLNPTQNGNGPIFPIGTTDGLLLSPLQRMQSIANSLMLQTTSSLQCHQSIRTVLPPISQEQFDLYSNVSTDELVKKVKDLLSQFSISQRLFGENVLGLSQGSVSDLLARPKPWHLLTQKGREPFIRMQIFLEDSQSVQKLVASQYRVPSSSSEKQTNFLCNNSSSSSSVAVYLDSTSAGPSNDNSTEVIGGTSAGTPPPLPLPLPPPHSSSLQSLMSLPAFYTSTAVSNVRTADMMTFPTSTDTMSSSSSLAAGILTSVSESKPSSNCDTSSSLVSNNKLVAGGGNGVVGFPPMGVAMFPSVLSVFGATFLPSTQFGPTMINIDDLCRLYGDTQTGPVALPGAASDVGGGGGAIPELDTQAITSKVKEVLQMNNLGQKLFGEAVLELSQGSVSELLSKPKPWHMLSLKGREPFVKMQLWLADPLGVQRLQAFQTQMAGRKRKSSCEGPSVEKSGNQKKPRLFFSEDQKESLRQAYIRDPYPNQTAIEELANELDIGVKTVVNWFHNHRMRAKQHQNCNSPTSTMTGSPSVHSNGTSLIKMETVEGEALSDLSSGSSSNAGRMGGLWGASDNAKTRKSKCDSSAARYVDRKMTVVGRREGEGERKDMNVVAPSHMQLDSSAFYSPDVTMMINDNKSRRHELNKRKRARPHRLCIATNDLDLPLPLLHSTTNAVIDLSISRAGSDISKNHDDRIAPVMHDQSKYERTTGNQCEDRDMTSRTSANDDEMQNELKNEKNVSFDGRRNLNDDDDDDDDDYHRKKNIEKLQQNLQQCPSDDWEF